MNIFNLLLKSSWKKFILAVAAGLLSGVSNAAIIALINHIINYPILKTSIILIFAGLCLVKLLANVLTQSLLIQLSQKAILDLRILLSERILASPLFHLEQLGSHRLLATLTDDIQAVSNTVFVLPNLVINIATVVGCLLYLCYLSSDVFLMIVIFIVIGIFSYQLPKSKATSFLTLAREQQDKLFKHFRSLIEGTKELKLHRYRRQAFLLNDLQDTAQTYRLQNVIGTTIFAAAASWGHLLFFVAIGFISFILPALNIIKTSILSGYILTIIYLITPLDYIMSILPVFSRVTVALKKIESLNLSLITNSENLTDLEESDLYCQRLELVNVTHTYHQEQEDSAFILGSIDLTFKGGELVFIVGGNGSGKSTLVKLITGLYIPETGEIKLNGKQITTDLQEWYRQHFSAVFSDFYLFENFLNLGKDIPDTQVEYYLRQLQLNHKVKVKNGVLSTTALSQGQRKRLALLAAYLEDRPIYVFDEWASDQDPIFKKIFYTQILPDLNKKDKTVLVVTHDEQYFHLCDRIIKLDYGKVITSQ
ncbi:cyclic peptide export ABC transporter [Nostoc sp. HG1]|nr:cyclic peptide export ABC transporter [Nostoc sp. HG1]